MKNLIALIAVIFAVNVQAGEYPDISIADLEKAIKSGKRVTEKLVADWIKDLPSGSQAKVTTIYNKASEVGKLKEKIKELEAEIKALKEKNKELDTLVAQSY